MDYGKLAEFKGWKAAQILRLIEISDVTKEMTVAAEHNDRVSFQMLLGERQEPIQQLWELEERIQQQLLSLPQDTAIRCNELLKGAEASAPEEEPLCAQVARYRRLLSAVVEADRRLSERMGGKKSFYRLLR